MNRQFPALRGIAIFLVIINHSIVLSLQTITQFNLPRVSPLEKGFLLAIKEIGVLAVPIFLFLAGAFMMYSLSGKTVKEGYRLILPALKNAVIPYILWSVIFYFIIFLVNHETYSLFGYIKNLLVGYPYNFVPILVFFILLSPILAWFSKKFPLITIALFLIYQIILLNIQLPGVLGFVFPNWMVIVSPPILGLPLTLWAVFYGFGMVYILYSEKYKKIFGSVSIPIGLFSLALYVVAVSREIGLIQFQLAEWLLPIITMLLLPFINRNSIPFVRFFEGLGKRSYGIYFMNLIIIKLLVFLFANIFPTIFRVETLLVIILSIFTYFITTFLMEKLEKSSARKYYRYIFG
jgi:peptidoglycan/LPS O-acetylase OafA/YrhL